MGINTSSWRVVVESMGFKNKIKIKLVCVLLNGVEILKLNMPKCSNGWELFLLYTSVSHLERKATLLHSFIQCVTSLGQIVSLLVELKKVTAVCASVFLCNVFLIVMAPEVIGTLWNPGFHLKNWKLCFIEMEKSLNTCSNLSWQFSNQATKKGVKMFKASLLLNWSDDNWSFIYRFWNVEIGNSDLSSGTKCSLESNTAENALLENACFNCMSSCTDISALTLSGNMMWSRYEARLFELSPSSSLVEAIVKE